jgi:hypothetical protein
VCFAFNRESRETTERPEGLFFFLHVFLHCCRRRRPLEDCLSKEEGRIGSNTMEAFALLVLVDNYKAWLYEEKKTYQTNLLTEYDSPPSYGKPSIVDKILDGVQFNLEEEAASPTVI